MENPAASMCFPNLSYNYIFLHLHKSSYIFRSLAFDFQVPLPMAGDHGISGASSRTSGTWNGQNGQNGQVRRRGGCISASWMMVVNLYYNGLWLVVSKIFDVPFQSISFFWLVIRNPLTNSYFSEGLKPPTSYG